MVGGGVVHFLFIILHFFYIDLEDGVYACREYL